MPTDKAACRVAARATIYNLAANLVLGAHIQGLLDAPEELRHQGSDGTSAALVAHYRVPGGGEVVLSVRVALDEDQAGHEIATPKIEIDFFTRVGTYSPARARALCVLQNQVTDLACMLEAGLFAVRV